LYRPPVEKLYIRPILRADDTLLLAPTASHSVGKVVDWLWTWTQQSAV